MTQLLFTEQLRASSSSLHGVSDALVVAKLMVAFTDRRVYGLALGSFYHVYLAIEQLLFQNKDTAALAPLAQILPRVQRHDKFAEDLEYFLGPDWETSVIPNKPVRRYVSRLQAIAKNQPYLLIGHSFAMHAALMAGGQLTKRMLTKHVKLEPGKGTATFDYQEPVQPLRAEYKRIINSLPGILTDQQAQEVLQEHQKAFEYNIAIVKDFHVGYKRFFFAIQKLIPGWVYMAGVLAIVAVWVALLAS